MFNSEAFQHIKRHIRLPFVNYIQTQEHTAILFRGFLPELA
jgi:hypothetical protein